MSDKKETIMDIITEVAEAFCNNYCKFPEVYAREGKEEDLMYDECCTQCQMNRLV